MQTNATLEYVKSTLFKKSRSSQSYHREDGSARAFAFYQRCSFSTSSVHLSHKLNSAAQQVESDTGTFVLLIEELVSWWDVSQSAQSSQFNLKECHSGL